MRHVMVVSGADAVYLPMLGELFDSVRAHGPRPESGLKVRCGAIDAGLDPAQRAALVAAGVLVRDLPDDPAFPRLALRRRPALAANIGKLWLDRLFPEADVLIWIDADAWIQRPGTIEHLVAAAECEALAICVECNRFKGDLVRVRWWLGGLLGVNELRSINIKNARIAGLGLATLRRLALKPTLNAGVYAMRRDAAGWEVMRARQRQVLRKGKPFSSDQLSMALAVHIDAMPVELLPDAFNHIGPWVIDPASRMLIERYYPYEPVRVVHMAAEKTMRFDLAARAPIALRGGGTELASLRRPYWTGVPD